MVRTEESPEEISTVDTVINTTIPLFKVGEEITTRCANRAIGPTSSNPHHLEEGQSIQDKEKGNLSKLPVR